MKKFLALLIAITFVVSFGTTTKTEAASPTDSWVDRDAKVSEEVYELLKERAGFAAYIYTDTKVSMKPENLAKFKIEEELGDFFIGSLNNNSNKILVTKDGLIVAYTPKEFAHTIYSSNLHFIDVQTAVKVFVGPTIQNVNYINFASLESNKAVNYYSGYKAKLKIPADATVNHIGYSGTYDTGYWKEDYGTILPRSLQAGVTHSVDSNGRIIDGIRVFTKGANSMNIFYTSNTPISVMDNEKYNVYNLIDKFVLDNGVTPEKSLIAIDINPKLITMKIGDRQTISVNGIYNDGSKQMINSSEVSWTSTQSPVAKVSNGEVEALALGNTTLIAVYNGKSTFVTVQVENYNELPKKLNQPVNKIWDVTFSTAVDANTVLQKNICVTDENGTTVPTVPVLVTKNVIQIYPATPYTRGKTYTVWVKDLKSATGQTIKQHTKMDFTIQN